jgi:hypothetical protein
LTSRFPNWTTRYDNIYASGFFGRSPSGAFLRFS